MFVFIDVTAYLSVFCILPMILCHRGTMLTQPTVPFTPGMRACRLELKRSMTRKEKSIKGNTSGRNQEETQSTQQLNFGCEQSFLLFNKLNLNFL